LSEKNIENLRPVSAEQFQFLKERDPLVLPANVGREDILAVDAETARQVVDIFISEKWSTFEYFTHPFLVNGKKMLFYPEDVLDFLARHYRVPSLFPLLGENLAKNLGPFKMAGLLLGKSRIVVFYPQNIVVKRLDEPFALFTGRYSFYRSNWVSICENDGVYELCDFVGRDSPSQPLRPLRGPFNFSIKRIRAVGDFSKIRVFFPLGYLTLPQPMFGKNESTPKVQGMAATN